MDNQDSSRTSPRFPHDSNFEVAGETASAEELVEVLASQLTERRRERIDEVIAGRTYDVTTVVDGPYDRGNVSAIIRTAEALGFQSMHVIETEEHFKEANRVTQGADKWLDITTWDQPRPCVEQLRERGYRICATHLEAATPIDAIDFSMPTAIIFGNEQDGVSEEVLESADERCLIPIDGFTQSFNISVAAALTLYHIRNFRKEHLGRHGDLNERESEILRASYYLRAVRRPDRLVPHLLSRYRDDHP